MGKPARLSSQLAPFPHLTPLHHLATFHHPAHLLSSVSGHQRRIQSQMMSSGLTLVLANATATGESDGRTGQDRSSSSHSIPLSLPKCSLGYSGDGGGGEMGVAAELSLTGKTAELLFIQGPAKSRSAESSLADEAAEASPADKVAESSPANEAAVF